MLRLGILIKVQVPIGPDFQYGLIKFIIMWSAVDFEAYIHSRVHIQIIKILSSDIF